MYINGERQREKDNKDRNDREDNRIKRVGNDKKNRDAYSVFYKLSFQQESIKFGFFYGNHLTS